METSGWLSLCAEQRQERPRVKSNARAWALGTPSSPVCLHCATGQTGTCGPCPAWPGLLSRPFFQNSCYKLPQAEQELAEVPSLKLRKAPTPLAKKGILKRRGDGDRDEQTSLSLQAGLSPKGPLRPLSGQAYFSWQVKGLLPLPFTAPRPHRALLQKRIFPDFLL